MTILNPVLLLMILISVGVIGVGQWFIAQGLKHLARAISHQTKSLTDLQLTTQSVDQNVTENRALLLDVLIKNTPPILGTPPPLPTSADGRRRGRRTAPPPDTVGIWGFLPERDLLWPHSRDEYTEQERRDTEQELREETES